jgi:hypothetical protein
VGFHSQAEMAGLVHGSFELLKRELLRFGIAAVREDGSRGKHFDMVGAIVRQQAHFLPNLPWAVRFSIVEIPGQLDIGRKAGHGARATGDGDVSSCHEHARSHDVAPVDGIAQRNIVEGTVHAHVAHRSESGLERNARVRHRFQNHARGAFGQL